MAAAAILDFFWIFRLCAIKKMSVTPESGLDKISALILRDNALVTGLYNSLFYRIQAVTIACIW